MSLPGLRTAGPWIATFSDGPLADQRHDRMFAVGPIWEEIELMKPMASDIDYWVVVGGDGIPPSPERWPGQLSYRLDEVVTMAGVDGEPVAYYLQKG